MAGAASAVTLSACVYCSASVTSPPRQLEYIRTSCCATAAPAVASEIFKTWAESAPAPTVEAAVVYLHVQMVNGERVNAGCKLQNR